MRQNHRLLLAGVAAGMTLLAGPARADDREQCASAADQAQQLRDDGKYRRARDQLLICARDVCPAPIKRDCLDWLTQMESIAPTVVLGARDGTRDLVDVKVYVDGALITEKLDGRPIPMDLGAHTFKFEWAGQTKEEQVVIGAGQKSRNIVTTFGPATPPTPPPTPGPAPDQRGEGSLVPAFVVGGIGILALGSFAIFGISGKSDVSEMEGPGTNACKPKCPEDRVDSARTKLIVADISLGISLVALGVATYMILTRPKIDTDNAVKTGLRSVTFDVGPTVGGAAGTIGARF
ncbi:MAG: hypothetical protein KF819_34170 [Labilithrix sp.]|nr:hypothetical protein [Labilithrix sp.]